MIIGIISLADTQPQVQRGKLADGVCVCVLLCISVLMKIFGPHKNTNIKKDPLFLISAVVRVKFGNWFSIEVKVIRLEWEMQWVY